MRLSETLAWKQPYKRLKQRCQTLTVTRVFPNGNCFSSVRNQETCSLWGFQRKNSSCATLPKETSMTAVQRRSLLYCTSIFTSSGDNNACFFCLDFLLSFTIYLLVGFLNLLVFGTLVFVSIWWSRVCLGERAAWWTAQIYSIVYITKETHV